MLLSYLLLSSTVKRALHMDVLDASELGVLATAI